MIRTYDQHWPFTRWEHGVFCTCHEEERTVRRPWFEGGNEEWMHDDDATFAVVVHAHVDTESKDCDSTYQRGHVSEPWNMMGEVDTTDAFTFQRWVLRWSLPLSLNREGTSKIELDETGARWSEPTDEGYSCGEVRFCEDAHCDMGRTHFRDSTAQNANY